MSDPNYFSSYASLSKEVHQSAGEQSVTHEPVGGHSSYPTHCKTTASIYGYFLSFVLPPSYSFLLTLL